MPQSSQEKRRPTGNRRAVPRGGRRVDDRTALDEALDRVRQSIPTNPPPLVLVVDDHSDGRELIAEYFSFLGFRVEEARTGAEAFDKATALLPDVVLMDVVLPDEDGLAVIKRLRATERTAHLRVAVCTASVIDPVRADTTRAQADMFIPKPIDLRVLAVQIAYLVAAGRSTVL